MSSDASQQQGAAGSNEAPTRVGDGIGSAQLEASIATLSAALACLDPRSPSIPLTVAGHQSIPPPQVGLANVLPALLSPLAPLPSPPPAGALGPNGQPAPGSIGTAQQPAQPFSVAPGGVTPAQAALLGRRAAFRPQDTFALCNQLVQSLQNPENETAKAMFLAEKLIADCKGDEEAKAQRLLIVRRRRHQEEKEVAGMTPDANQRTSTKVDRTRPSRPRLVFPDTLPDVLPDSFTQADIEHVCGSFAEAMASQGQDGALGNGIEPLVNLSHGSNEVKVHLERFRSVPGGIEASLVVDLLHAGAGHLVVRFSHAAGERQPTSEIVSVNFRSQREVAEEATLTASSRWHMASRYPLYREISLQLQSSILQPAKVEDSSTATDQGSQEAWKPLLSALHHIAAMRSLYDVAPPRLDQLMTGQVPLTATPSVTRDVLYWKGCNVKWACSVPAAQAIGVGADGAPVDLSTLPGSWSAHYGLCAMNL